MSRSFNPDNQQVRQVVTPDGVGSYVFKDADNPDKFYIQVRIGDEKIGQFRAYAAQDLQEVEK